MPAKQDQRDQRGSSTEMSARNAALAALMRWDPTDAAAPLGEQLSDVLARERFSKLSQQDKAFARSLSFGVARNLRVLDHLIGIMRPPSKGAIEERVRECLRLGLYQIFFTGTEDHAAVNESVELAGSDGGHRGQKNLVNALLRRALRERSEFSKTIEKLPLATRYSHPSFLVEKWEQRYGEEAARQLLEWNQEPAPLYLRANSLIEGSEQALAQTGEAVAGHPDFFLCPSLPMDLIDSGQAYVCDPATAHAVELIDAQSGQRILDACAAPGGKTAYLAQIMGNEGKIVAADAQEDRLDLMEENLERLQVSIAESMRADWMKEASDQEGDDDLKKGSFDAILIDAPCSNSGVMRRRLEVRYRLSPKDFAKLPLTQLGILYGLVPYLKEGGRLVYSTCSIEPEENEEVVAKFLKGHPQFSLIEQRSSLPHRDGFDGAYAALLQEK